MVLIIVITYNKLIGFSKQMIQKERELVATSILIIALFEFFYGNMRREKRVD